MRGGYVMWVQNLGEQFQLAARYDAYDRNVHVDHDQYERLGVGLNWYYDGATRVTVSYDMPSTEVSAGGGAYQDPADNLLTVQFQYKF